MAYKAHSCFTVHTLVYNPHSCLQTPLLYTLPLSFTIPIPVCNSNLVYSPLSHLNPLYCLQSHSSFTYPSFVYNSHSYIQSLLLFTIPSIVYSSYSCLQHTLIYFSHFYFNLLLYFHSKCVSSRMISYPLFPLAGLT